MGRWVHIACLLLLPVTAMAVIEEEELKEIVEEKYTSFNKALVGRDLGAYAALCTADCRFKTRPGGPPLSLDQFKRFRERGFRTMTVKRAQTVVDSVQVHGDRATVRATWTADLAARAGKAIRNLRAVQKLQDTWSRVGDDWKLSASAVVSPRTTELPRPSRA